MVTLTCQISSRSVYSVDLWRGGEKPHFCRFWTSAFSGVAIWQQSEKVEHACTTTNLPLSNGIKIVSVLQRRHGKIGRTVRRVKFCMHVDLLSGQVLSHFGELWLAGSHNGGITFRDVCGH